VRAGNKLAMKQFGGKLTDQLMELTTMVRGDLNSLNRKKINQLIIIDVHARDIIDTFVRDSVLDAREFAWESQLRFKCSQTFGLEGRVSRTPLRLVQQFWLVEKDRQHTSTTSLQDRLPQRLVISDAKIPFEPDTDRWCMESRRHRRP